MPAAAATPVADPGRAPPRRRRRPRPRAARRGDGAAPVSMPAPRSADTAPVTEPGRAPPGPVPWPCRSRRCAVQSPHPKPTPAAAAAPAPTRPRAARPCHRRRNRSRAGAAPAAPAARRPARRRCWPRAASPTSPTPRRHAAAAVSVADVDFHQEVCHFFLLNAPAGGLHGGAADERWLGKVISGCLGKRCWWQHLDPDRRRRWLRGG
jgi:hypothetical protein